MKRSRHRFLLALLGCAFLLLPAPAQAADEHVLDPTLSLTGSGTVTSVEDEVVDPGTAHPPTRFEAPCGTGTDPHGNIYVSSPKLSFGTVVATRLDVFNPQGEFLVRTEVAHRSACGLAVDSEGNVYSGGIEGPKIDLFEPSSYPPTASTTYTVTELLEPFPDLGCPARGLTVDPSNDHLHVNACHVYEFGSAAEGSPQLGKFELPKEEIAGGTPSLSGFDVYGKNQDIYAAVRMQTSSGSGPLPSRVYVFDGADGHVKCEILGAEAPGDLDFVLGAAVAADQETGDLYVYDVSEEEGAVYQFAVEGEDECELISIFSQPPVLKGLDPAGDIAVDAPMEAGEAGYDSPNQGYVYATSGKAINSSHLWAWEPKIGGPPTVQAQEAAQIGEAEAVLTASLSPGARATSYRFEYTTQAAFQAEGYASAISVPVPDADAGAGNAFLPVSEPIAGLAPDTAYRFRLVASNCDDPEAEAGNCLTVGEGDPGGEGEDANFSTYPPAPDPRPCPNEALRSGLSASLPDCRAYELVTPPSTGVHTPKISILGQFSFIQTLGFKTTPASPAGDSVVFGSNSGALPGLGGGGFLDTYRTLRDPVLGWRSEFAGFATAQAARPRPGGISPDHLYSFWSVQEANDTGTLADPGGFALYLRLPAGIEPSPNCAVEAEPHGDVEWIGCGSLGHDPAGAGTWISEGGEHVIFETGVKNPPIQLEPCAPPDGVAAVYDRTPAGPTHCVSVPPTGASAEVEKQFETQHAAYRGASADGTTVVFEMAGTLYARLDNAETVVVAGDATFAGISDDGDRVFFLREALGLDVPRGELFACNVADGSCEGADAAQEPIQVGSGGEAAVVNVSADGSHAYFVSPELLDGEAGVEGEDNLYAWDGKAVSFVAVLDPLDVTSVDAATGANLGLGHWIDQALAVYLPIVTGPGNAPSRTTPDGKTLVFESRADLTGSGYDNDGHTQVFRYDSEAPAGEALACLSCNPSGEPARSDARLQIPENGDLLALDPSPVNAMSQIANVTTDGQRVFFQSADRLVASDRDGRLDVYEWQAQGTGGCEREAGCLALISSPRSAEDEYLYAMTPDGSDVFFLSGGTLTHEDPDGTPSIYDARVGGGFPPPVPPSGECLGEACQPTVSAPDDPTPATAGAMGPGNVGEPPPSCAPSARKAKRLANRAKRLHRAAERATAPARARTIRRRANRVGMRAKELSRSARRCRAARNRASRERSAQR